MPPLVVLLVAWVGIAGVGGPYSGKISEEAMNDRKDLASTLDDEGLLAADSSPVVPSDDLLIGTQDPSSPSGMMPMPSGRR